MIATDPRLNLRKSWRRHMGGYLRGGGHFQLMQKYAGTLPTAKTCLWIKGEPRGWHTKWCGAKTEPGKPYCAKHCKRAYQPHKIEAMA